MTNTTNSTGDTWILGIYAYFHDSSACLLHNGELVAMAEEERFNRDKHSSAFPEEAINFCLGKAGIKISKVNAIAFGMRPWHYVFNRLLTVARFLPGSMSVIPQKSDDISLGERVSGLFHVKEEFEKRYGIRNPRIYFIDHHKAHAYSAYYVSPFSDAGILIIDGAGEYRSSSLYRGVGDVIDDIGHVLYPDSLGVFYSVITEHLGFKPLFDEYKVMGLAAYGNDTFLPEMRKLLFPSGKWGYKLGYDYYSIFTKGTSQWGSMELEKILGPRKSYADTYEQRHFDIARSAQTAFEEACIRMGSELKEKCDSENLCIAGGCAQNVLMNRVVLDKCRFEKLYVPPSSYDGGVSLGAALAVNAEVFVASRSWEMARADFGPSFSTIRCEDAARIANLDIARPQNLSRLVAGELSRGAIVGYFSARMETGPRALGQRSILADPRHSKMKDTLNSRIKKREFFRPFAPIVTREDCARFFDIDQDIPFMTVMARVRDPQLIPAVTHKDGTARVQTVDRHDFPELYGLLKAFEEVSGVPILINTSFNENEPIVCTPEEAVDCFLRTRMDLLVFNHELVAAKKQLNWGSG